MTTAEEYRTAAHQLYDQALVELEAGDLRQASEKLWGAAAQVLKSSAKPPGALPIPNWRRSLNELAA